MGKGFLKVQLHVGDYALHGSSVEVLVKKDGELLHTLQTDKNGSSIVIELSAPDISDFFDNLDDNMDNPGGKFFETYDVEVPQAHGYGKANIFGIQIYDGITSILPIHLEPVVPNSPPEMNVQEIYIPREHGVDMDRDIGAEENSPPDDAIPTFEEAGQSPEPATSAEMARARAKGTPDPRDVPFANDIIIPDFITVHLGSPNAAARNVRVPFREYIKNVCSSEIYPTWDRAAIEANVYAQISFTLNRVFTLWYRSRGRQFDVTNNIQFDQYFVYGREIFQNVALIVDQIFNRFIRRPGRREPFFAAYCNGTTSTCAGMSQHGTQALARQGYSSLQILRHYYPADIDVVQSNNFGAANAGIFPGTALKEGSSGGSVRLMQLYLNRISGNWWIPAISVPDGTFETDTRTTVVAFQRLFNLNADGIIGSITWYEITRIYVAARRLAELDSEGQRYSIGENPPTTDLSQGARGEEVVELQFLLNFIASFYNDLPFVVEDSVFRETTRSAVLDFQMRFALTPDGVVRSGTWTRLYEVYQAIRATAPFPQSDTSIKPFSGTPLEMESKGDNVRTMQTYLNSIAKSHPSIGTLAVDGIFGSKTQEAVREFQQLFGLDVDGVIGQVTWYKIVEVYNLLQSGAKPKPPLVTPPQLELPQLPLEPPYPGTLLRIGSRGEDVRTMQRMINSIAQVFPIIPGKLVVDGNFGLITQTSVIALQNFFGLVPDGIIGPLTWKQITEINATLPNITASPFPGNFAEGTRGNNVQIIQQSLNELAPFYPTITQMNVDGIFEPITKSSVLEFQRIFGMASTGIVNQTTWNLIISMRNLLMQMSEVAMSQFATMSSDVPASENTPEFMESPPAFEAVAVFEDMSASSGNSNEDISTLPNLWGNYSQDIYVPHTISPAPQNTEAPFMQETPFVQDFVQDEAPSCACGTTSNTPPPIRSKSRQMEKMAWLLALVLMMDSSSSDC